MTLHFYGSVDGALLSISDGLTSESYEDGRDILCDSTLKAFVYPAVPDGTPWQSGRFSALVMVQGRAYFPETDGTKRDALALLQDAVSARSDDPFKNTTELGLALWDVVRHHWYQCGDCTDERARCEAVNIEELRDYEMTHPDSNQEGEYGCDRHWKNPLIVIVMGNDPDGDNHFRREWAHTQTSGRVDDRVIMCSADDSSGNGESDKYCVEPVPPALNLKEDAEKIFELLNARFTDIALENRADWSADYGSPQPGSIGGHIQSCVIDVENGPVARPSWYLNPEP